MIKCKKYAIVWVLLFFVVAVQGYGLPSLGLGFTSILEGGPVRPNPGLYWQQWLQYYTTKRFLDHKGKALNGVPSPPVREFDYVVDLAYQFERQTVVGAMPGVEMVLPFVLASKVDKDNALNLKTSGSGVGDLGLGVYLQWPALFRNGRHIFVHRLEFGMVNPSGKNKLPEKQINPGRAFFLLWSNLVGYIIFVT